ncbi:MAG: FAD-dependent oxidoreductase, partial [Alistipes sp.]|nr:FAD-dependent oxidoreductase [Alistipes sp.]
MEDSIPYRRLEVNCKYFFPEGGEFSFYHDTAQLKKEMDRAAISDPGSVLRRLEKSAELYELSAPVFIFSNFHKLSNFNTLPYRNIAKKLHKLDFLRTMHGANRNSFPDERMVKIFDRYATYNGSNPYKAPATLNMIANIENNIGAYFPEKGMYSIVEGLWKLALRQGVEFRFGENVKKIVTQSNRAVGIETEATRQKFDTVISDVDVMYLSRCLLDKHPLRNRLERSRPSSSALIFYWQVERQFPELDLHNILFASDYKSEFDAIFNRADIADDSTVYIFISSKKVESDAPKGCENWFVMINVPSDTGQNWKDKIARARRNIVDKINNTLSTDIEKYISVEHIASPRTIEENTSSAGGALYGAASNSTMAAFLRHPNMLKGFDNLYFTGGSVHPGGGIPLCSASASIRC